MTGPTQALSDYTPDTRILARCARGFDWNYIAAGESFTTGGNVTYNTTIDTAGAVGGRITFALAIEAAMGAYSNAGKDKVTYGDAGSTAGLGSVRNAELVLSAGTVAGSYACYEAEMVAPAGAAVTPTTSFFYANGSGANVAAINANANFAEIGAGLTVGAGATNFIDTGAGSGGVYGGMRVYVEGVGVKYVALLNS